MTESSEAERLEQLWAGEFGDSYVERNANAYEGRRTFWTDLLARHPCRTVLEVGSNLGGNLRWIRRVAPAEALVVGVDVNAGALTRMRDETSALVPIRAAARGLPFADHSFDLTFTAGVLIHQPDESLREVMGEILRCSRRLVLCAEYHASSQVEVQYRGESGALFKRNYGDLYRELSDDLILREHGVLGRDDGWDDVTWWLFERSTQST
jgi:pseudaminic acid biosynthesis-associated methylase